MAHNVNCIKCKRTYKSEEPDDDYCPDCLVLHRQLIIEVDAKMKNKPRKQVMSDLQRFDAIAKQRGGGSFVKCTDMGINI